MILAGEIVYYFAIQGYWATVSLVIKGGILNVAESALTCIAFPINPPTFIIESGLMAKPETVSTPPTIEDYVEVAL